MDTICFHLITEPNAYLSNWYPAAFRADGLTYCCAEQFIMREKAVLFGDTASAERIMQTDDPEAMQAIGQQVAGFDDDTWYGFRQLIGHRALRAKFSQNALLRERLVGTGDALLVECAFSDPAWGAGVRMNSRSRFSPTKWPGRNILGFALMDVRDELRERFSGDRARTPLVHAFATRLAAVAAMGEEGAILASITPEEMESCGLVVDAYGCAFERVCGFPLLELPALSAHAGGIDDAFILGSGIYARWCFHTQRAPQPMTPDDARWFRLAATRLVEITG